MFMVFSSLLIAPYGNAIPEAEGRAGWGQNMPALSNAEREIIFRKTN
jgi:hypothetical protein